MHTASLFRSSTFRLALLYAVLFSVSVLFLFGFIYWSTAAYLARQTDATIEAEIKGLAERYAIGGVRGLSNVIGDRISRQQPTGSSIYLLTDASFDPLVGNLSRWPSQAQSRDGWVSFELRDQRGGGDPLVHMARARPFVLGGGYRLLVGRDIRELEEAQKRIVSTLIWGLAITLLLGLAGGVLLSRTVSRRIEIINDTSREIISGDLSRRIPTRGTDDEFDQLADNLNTMLNRIESLMESVRRVSDNIAHDLKTPLSRLRNRLEAAKLQTGNSDQQRAELEQASAEADQLLSTFNALLRIARIEAGKQHAGFTNVDLAALVTDVAELYEPLADEKKQRLVVNTTKASCTGDRDLLFQALANLVDNAVKHTPENCEIQITLQPVEGGTNIVVSDQGPGIPQEHAEDVFQRFYRLDRSRNTPGSGLGLSLVAAVADLHKIEIQLQNLDPGLRVRLFIPGSLVIAGLEKP